MAKIKFVFEKSNVIHECDKTLKQIIEDMTSCNFYTTIANNNTQIINMKNVLFWEVTECQNTTNDNTNSEKD